MTDKRAEQSETPETDALWRQWFGDSDRAMVPDYPSGVKSIWAHADDLERRLKVAEREHADDLLQATLAAARLADQLTASQRECERLRGIFQPMEDKARTQFELASMPHLLDETRQGATRLAQIIAAWSEADAELATLRQQVATEYVRGREHEQKARADVENMHIAALRQRLESAYSLLDDVQRDLEKDSPDADSRYGRLLERIYAMQNDAALAQEKPNGRRRSRMTDEQMREIARKHQNSDGPQRWDEDNVVAAIAEAVAAERERVDKLLSDRAAWLKKEAHSGGDFEHLITRAKECAYIAAAIRQPEAGTKT